MNAAAGSLVLEHHTIHADREAAVALLDAKGKLNAQSRARLLSGEIDWCREIVDATYARLSGEHSKAVTA